MCVAAVIFNPVPMADLKDMEDSNPHGAGVAWEQDGEIRFIKGLDAADIFQLQEDKVLKYPYLLHFRWATHGGKIPQLTHPFPLGPRALMGELHGGCQSLLIHNGTWNSYMHNVERFVGESGNYEIPEEIINEMSDTAIAAYMAYYDEDILDDIAWATALAEMRGGSMEIVTRGTWYDHEGNWYSNLHWKNTWSYSSSGFDYEGWNNWYKQGLGSSNKFEDTLPDSVKSNYDRYIERIVSDEIQPFACRGEADIHLSWEEYVQKYGAIKSDGPDANAPVETITARTGTTDELSFEEYVRQRYGDAAEEILACLPENGDDTERNEDDVPGIDPDIVSENFETVNEVLRRQMNCMR